VYPIIPGCATGTLRNFKIVTLVAANDPDKDQLFQFADAVPSSNWWQESARSYNLGAISANVNLTGAALTGSTIDQAGIIQWIQSTITGNPMAQNDGNTLYNLFLPPGVNEGAMGAVGCSTFGYHTVTPDGLVWGFSQRCPSTASWLTPLDVVISTSAHEIIEAATDPVMGYRILPGNPPWSGSVWTSAGQGEVGDLCDASYILEGNFIYQRSYSNIAAAAGDDPCVPAIDKPYYGARAPKQWYSLTPGASVTIPVTTFGAEKGMWSLEVSQNPPAEKPGGDFGALKLTATLDGMPGPIMVSSGQTVMLQVTADPAAASKQYHIVQLRSTMMYTTRASQDERHDWPVGLYIP
jgi:hypothetical protein